MIKGVDAAHIDAVTLGAAKIENGINTTIVINVLRDGLNLRRCSDGRVDRPAKVERVSQSWQTIPHFYTTITIDMTHLMATKAKATGPMNYTDYIASAVIRLPGLAARKCSERALRMNEAGTAAAVRLQGVRA